jgi:hypothetical protein
MRRALLAVLLSLCTFSLCSCGAISGCGGSISFADPLFRVISATDSTTGAAIPRIILSNITYAGTPADVSQLTLSPSFGVAVEGNAVVCNLPCGFGTEAGRYTFSVSAAGHNTSDVVQEGRFQSAGGCPLVYAGSTVLQFSLQPQ